MSFLIKKIGLGLGVSLILLLCFFVIKAQRLENNLNQKVKEVFTLESSVVAGELTLKAVLENEKNNNARIKELEEERSLLRAQSKEQRKQLEEFIRYDEKSSEWAKQEIPSNILSLLLDSGS